MMQTPPPAGAVSRRDFVRSAAVLSAGFATGLTAMAPLAYAAGSDVIRVGLVGCGGRGMGAANDCVRSSSGVQLVAIGDLFEDQVTAAKSTLKQYLGDAYAVKEDHCFSGFDNYQKVIDSGIDVVILASPPGFRPQHLRAAIEAGKHVFAEKPIAVDSAGIRSALESSDMATQKNLSIVAGTQRRHHHGYIEAMRRLHEGAIGDLMAIHATYNSGGYRDAVPRQPDMSDVEAQIRNWYYYGWLSGDHIVEQAVHRMDIANWALQAHPVRAVAVGGRAARNSEEYGNIYDHFGVDYEYESGARVTHMCRQIKGTPRRVKETYLGSNGTAETSDRTIAIQGPNQWRYGERAPNPYVQEHADLIAGIRAGQPLNEGRRTAESVLTSIMGREAAYTGQTITWDEILKADLDLMPKSLAFGPLPVAPVPEPGVTKLERSRQA